MKTVTETPRVYVACLASYNAGLLHGGWVDAVDAEALQGGIDAVIKSSPTKGAEEWAFHDFEGFGDCALSPTCDVEELAEIGALILEHGEVAKALMSHHAGHIDQVTSALENGPSGPYRGSSENEALGEYAAQMAEDCGDLRGAQNGKASWLLKYVDWEAVGRDMRLGGDAYALQTSEGWYVFAE